MGDKIFGEWGHYADPELLERYIEYRGFVRPGKDGGTSHTAPDLMAIAKRAPKFEKAVREAYAKARREFFE